MFIALIIPNSYNFFVDESIGNDTNPVWFIQTVPKMNVFHIQSIGIQWHCDAMNQCLSTFQKSSFGHSYFTISLLHHDRNDPGSSSKVRLNIGIKSCHIDPSEYAPLVSWCNSIVTLAKQIDFLSRQNSLTAVPTSTTYRVIVLFF